MSTRRFVSLRAIVACALLASTAAIAPSARGAVPQLGAQIWIEPGQTPEEIDRWFATLADAHMPVARLFLMWNYLEPRPGEWDFALYDAAFRSAERHGVRIVATLTPNFGPTHRGYVYRTQGSGATDTAARLGEAARYVDRVVERYRSSPALDTWLLVNEPGQAPAPNALAVARFREWLRTKYKTVERLDAAWLANFASFDEVVVDPAWAGGGFAWPVAAVDWYAFWREHLAWYLSWIAGRVRQRDPAHGIHVNPHALVGNLASNSFDLPQWRPFLTSLGASIHPAWHFGLLGRDQYALGVSYVCDLVAGASEPKPFWITELQGGNNISSGVRPLDPDERDIAQWVWTGVGAGAERVIFWLLNARRQGGEAAEWSMLDFQGGPSERLRAASEVARRIEANAGFFEAARPIESPVTVILSLDAMTLQELSRSGDDPARDRNAHVLAALAYYQALAELGVPARVKLVGDYDWRATGGPARIAILAHVTALSEAQARDLEGFVRNGNTLVVTGLTGLYDPEWRAWPLVGFPLAGLFGGTLKEVRVTEDRSSVTLTRPAVTLPYRLWEGEIANRSAEVVGRDGERVTAVVARAGNGTVVWIPSTVGLGAWTGDRAPLSSLVADLTSGVRGRLPFTFAARAPDCLMRVLRSGDAYLTVITNGANEPRGCRVRANGRLAPHAIWGPEARAAEGTVEVDLGPRETRVLLWR